MKTPESCENSVRNRKKKENGPEKSEKCVKNSSKSSEKMEVDPAEVATKKVEQMADESLKVKERIDVCEEGSRAEDNFRIKFQIDPMSLALFALAIVTRFYRLAEPRNVV